MNCEGIVDSSIHRLVLAVVLIVALPLRARGQDAGQTDEALLRKAGLTIDGPSLLKYLSDQAGNRKRVPELIRQLGNRSFAAREKATADLVALGSPAVSALQAATRDADAEVAARAARCLEAIRNGSSRKQTAAVVRLLALRKPEGCARVLLEYLPCVEDGLFHQEVCLALAAVAMRAWPG